MRNLKVLLSLLLVLFLSAAVCRGADGKGTDEMIKQRAVEFVGYLADGKFDAAVAMFDEAMTKAVPIDKLEQLWKQIVASCGKFERTGEVDVEHVGVYRRVSVSSGFEKNALSTKVVFDRDGRVSGLFFDKAQFQSAEDAVEAMAGFTEREVVIGDGQWKLPGTLSVPDGQGRFPAVVLVHGSGPLDRDESIGANKPFRDIAWGLAKQGIVVLRYDKRTFHYADKVEAMIDSLTVDDEVIDDAVLAVEMLGKVKEVDANSVFVIGHSLGGMMACEIANRSGAVKGVVIMAASLRSMHELMYEQLEYIANLDGVVSDDEQAQLSALKGDVEKINAIDSSSVSDSNERILGVGSRYWADINGRDIAGEIKKFAGSVLILQGESDYQVRMKDFEQLKKEVGQGSGREFKSYTRLNHLFMETGEKSVPDDYFIKSKVRGQVLDDIAEWITDNR